MYKPNKLDIGLVTFREVCLAIDNSTEELQNHCKLIAELQAINMDLLNRIKLLEEEKLKCNFS